MTVRYKISNVLNEINLVKGYEVVGILYNEQNEEVVKLSMKGSNKFQMMKTIKENLEPYKNYDEQN